MHVSSKTTSCWIGYHFQITTKKKFVVIWNNGNKWVLCFFPPHPVPVPVWWCLHLAEIFWERCSLMEIDVQQWEMRGKEKVLHMIRPYTTTKILYIHAHEVQYSTGQTEEWRSRAPSSPLLQYSVFTLVNKQCNRDQPTLLLKTYKHVLHWNKGSILARIRFNET